MQYKKRELTPEEFRKMQLLELDMLVEFDRLCQEHGINYVIFGGTMLGAVRHKGYIPWDDDADIAMLREDYEKFKTVCNQLNKDICYFQDHTTDKMYRWGYGKLRRTGTTYIRVGQEHLKCLTGVFVDIFPMDDVPKSLPLQILQDRYCYCLRKILWSEVAKHQTHGLKKLWFSMLSHIPTKRVFHWLTVYTRRSSNASSNRVRCLLFPATGTLYVKNPTRERYSMPKSWFTQRARYEFEKQQLYGTRDYDSALSYIYRDYMKLPPENKREQHSPVSYIDFGNVEPINLSE